MTSQSKNNFDDVDQLIGDVSVFNEMLEQEQLQATLSTNYIEIASEINFSSVDEFIVDVYSVIDTLIPASKALKIINILNEYVGLSDDGLKTYQIKYGKYAKTYVKLERIFREVKEDSIRDIWQLRSVSKSMFIDIVKLASREHGKLIERPLTAHLALLRFYIINLLFKVQEKEESGILSAVEFGRLVYIISLTLKNMETCWRATDYESLERMLSYRKSLASDAKKEKKFQKEGEIARSAWSNGCELLHVQMCYLVEYLMKIDAEVHDDLKEKLKGMAPDNLKFGSGAKKKLNSCPCSKKDSCPLVIEFNIRKKISLPTSKRPSRQKS